LVHFKPEIPEGMEEEEFMKRIEAKDPFEPRLKPITQDKPVGGYKNAWKLKVYGDYASYNSLGKEPTKTSYGAVSVKSIIWPGAVTVYNNKQWQSLYVGHGFKLWNNEFYPYDPQTVQVEHPDPEEQPEPNFPPEQKKQDAGDQGAKGDDDD